jgi:hypothetical protein
MSRIEIPGVLDATRLKNGKVDLTVHSYDSSIEMTAAQANDLATWIFATDMGNGVTG